MGHKAENTEKNPRISVYILTYNRAKLLPRAINSVLNQTFSDFELIIINDASPDNTDEVVNGFDDKRIIYKKHDKNTGLFGAANTALDMAKGKYIIFLTDDDEFLPDALEVIDNKFRELSPKGIKILWFDCVDAESGKYSGSGIRKEGYILYEDYLCNKISGDYWMAIDRDAIGDNRYDARLWGTMASVFLIRLHKNNKAFYVPKTICKLYREHGESRMSEPETSLLKYIPKIVLTMKVFLKEYGDDTKSLCSSCYGQRLASLGFYQILNNEKREGRSNVFKSFNFHFSPAHFAVFLLSFILTVKQLKYVCLKFFRISRRLRVFTQKITKAFYPNVNHV
jgi:glycosyltransferase involved in cell wall biosynthesis